MKDPKHLSPRTAKVALTIAVFTLLLVGGLAMTRLALESDFRGSITYGRPVSDTVNARSLSAGAAETETVPAGAHFVIFSATGDFYAKTNGAAAVPGDVTDGTASELNPSMWTLTGVTTISVISEATTKITFTYYKKNN